MQLSKITSILEEFAPLGLQESYDNAGLIIGSYSADISAALICIDITEEIVEEAISKNCNLIISHHPLIFNGLKKINGKNYVERCLISAIKNDIAIYACHTNIDSITNGVSFKMAEKLNLDNCKILSPSKGNLNKIICYVPTKYQDTVRQAMFDAGAGSIGEYTNCSFNTCGQGTFKAGENSNPYIGEKNKQHFEEEVRIETIVHSHLVERVTSAMISKHPYEEVAYDIYPISNINRQMGFGVIGELEHKIDSIDFLQNIKKVFNCQNLKHTRIVKEQIKKVALCGGSGSFLLNTAISNKADIYISGDFKYHDYFSAENKIIVADIGHYESEQFTKEIFYELLTKNLPNFALRISEINTNPINYI